MFVMSLKKSNEAPYNPRSKAENSKTKKSQGHLKSILKTTVNNIIKECCKQQNTSPHMLTQCFLRIILEEMTSLAQKKISHKKLKVINQISCHLSDFIHYLDMPYKSNQGDQTNPSDQETTHTSLKLPFFHLSVALNELKKNDDSIHDLLAEKQQIYERLQMFNCSFQASSTVFPSTEVDSEPKLPCSDNSIKASIPHEIEESNIDICDPEIPHKINSSQEEIEEVDASDSEIDSTLMSPSQPVPNSTQYFDENVLNAAAFCAKQQLSLPVKEEIDVNIENVDNITFRRFTGMGATQMKMTGHTLICAATNGKIIRFCFKGNVFPYLPHRTKSYDICSSSVADMTLWNNHLIITTVNGTVSKCSLSCKVTKELRLEHPITATTELVGLFYAASKTGYLYVINLRSMTLHKAPVELGHVVSMMKSSVFNSAALLVFLTDKNEIIGTSVVDGYIDSVMFKFALPSMTVFDIVENADLPQVLTFFCGTPSSTSCLQLTNDTLSQGSIIHHGTSAMLTHFNLLFLGSLDGDITIVNLKSKNTYCYRRIIKGKITSFACLIPSLYIGTESSIYCMLIDNNDVIKII